MLEHRLGRKPLRDLLRQVACPGADEVGMIGAAATAAGGVNGGPPSKDEVRGGLSRCMGRRWRLCLTNV